MTRAASAGRALRLRYRHRYLIELDRVLERELVERRFSERRLGGGMAQRLRVRPRAVETGKVAGPQEIVDSDLGHAPEAGFFLDLEREVDLFADEIARFLRERDVGRKHAAFLAAKFVLPVEPPEQERDPADAGLFEDEAHAGMAVADAGEHDGAHQF